MEKQYNHKDHEDRLYALWEKKRAFQPSETGEPYTIIMPPPNANDPLHVGHAMFATIEDILIRYHRMKGRATLWLPGTDHAGIETQFVFEKKLAKEGKSRFQFDRETLYKMIMEYVRANSNVAVDQLKKLGASADWSRFKFTLDDDIVEKVLETFAKLHKDNLVYRGEKLVNYCTKCGTGYSELEVVHEEKTSPLYYIRYYYADNKDAYVVVATTRPEPIYADTHLAIHPKNPKTKNLKGVQLLNPLTGSVMQIIEDSFVDPEFGTGIVKLTPAHDQTDFEVALKFDLPIIKAVGTDGKMIGGPCDGMSVNNARLETVKILTESGHVEKINEKYTNNVGTCYRCHRTLEPLPMAQFFIKTKPLVKKALVALDTKETIVVGAGQEKILRHWLNNIRDWNISRQIVWGIRIPVWYKVKSNTEGKQSKILVKFVDKNGAQQTGFVDDFLKTHTLEEIRDGLQTITAPKEESYIVSTDSPGDDYLQETDTFDTWFSSGQWPVVTLHTSGKNDFERFYPTALMETGYDILPIWVMRMMLLGCYITDKSPFKAVYLHGLVRDEKGRKMSKSVGNVINPLEIVEKYGTDALRFALVMSTTPAKDKGVGENTFRGMRNFTNKIWNASRFLLMSKESLLPDSAPGDKAFIKKLNTVVTQVSTHLDALRIGQAAELVYGEFWHWFCDSAIEDAKAQKLSFSVLLQGLVTFLKLLHPFVPFVTEAVFEVLTREKCIDSPTLLITADWPKVSSA